MQRISPREFFASLTYGFNADCGEQFPVFSPAELQEEPLKWLKYLLLARLGLRSLEGLSQEIRRFSVNNRWLVQENCQQALLAAQRNQKSVLIVIKLISPDRGGQFPNFRIERVEEMPAAMNFVDSAQGSDCKEIWICQSIVGRNTSNFAGRIVFPTQNGQGVTRLEIVWFTSPRLLEHWTEQNFSYPYLRASKTTGRLRFELEKLYVPEHEVSQSSDQYLQDFEFLQTQFFHFKEKISALEDILSAAGAREISLEFKSEDGVIQFIDWDTEIETVGGIN